eukprot:gnl/Dysnectes_brevis/6319_a9720_251.p1 GENE.gnl/Dysnectes_brevis/6319_a9720_251~~gnl/Dysnectes_brevis/6319_a9720_251.p1  ORF type:complete len:400 (+),score=70.58 gnl/Dysnectes_brevis/6319_a9720_251:20-1219(+)
MTGFYESVFGQLFDHQISSIDLSVDNSRIEQSIASFIYLVLERHGVHYSEFSAAFVDNFVDNMRHHLIPFCSQTLGHGSSHLLPHFHFFLSPMTCPGLSLVPRILDHQNRMQGISICQLSQEGDIRESVYQTLRPSCLFTILIKNRDASSIQLPCMVISFKSETCPESPPLPPLNSFSKIIVSALQVSAEDDTQLPIQQLFALWHTATATGAVKGLAQALSALIPVLVGQSIQEAADTLANTLTRAAPRVHDVLAMLGVAMLAKDAGMLSGLPEQLHQLSGRSSPLLCAFLTLWASQPPSPHSQTIWPVVYPISGPPKATQPQVIPPKPQPQPLPQPLPLHPVLSSTSLLSRRTSTSPSSHSRALYWTHHPRHLPDRLPAIPPPQCPPTSWRARTRRMR